VEVLDFKAFDE